MKTPLPVASLFLLRSVAVGLTFGVFLVTPPTADAATRTRQVSARSMLQGYAVDPAVNDTIRPSDRAFLNKATESTRQQMRLAEVGVSQARDARVRSHAQQMVSDFRSMNESLEALLRRKGGIAGAPVGGTSENYQKLVDKPGALFDREFVRAAGQTGDQLLALFEQVASESRDADVREFASAQLPVLRGLRAAMTELRKTFD